MPTCFSKDECDGLWKLFFWRQPKNLSLLLSRLSCFLSTHVSFWCFFSTEPWSQGNRFSLSQALHSNHLKTISGKRSSYLIPLTYHFSSNQHKNISSWRINSLSPSFSSRTRCARLLGICSSVLSGCFGLTCGILTQEESRK
jgi:hypothetical protein